MAKKNTSAKKAVKKDEVIEPTVQQETPVVDETTQETVIEVDEKVIENPVDEEIAEVVPAKEEEGEETEKLPVFERNLPKAEKGKVWATSPSELVEVEGIFQDQKGKLYLGAKKK